MKKAESLCGAAVQERIAPALEAAVSAVLGNREGRWFEFLIDSATRSPVLLFHYPSARPTGFEYLKRSVKLEFGSLTDQQPTGRHSVRPWVAEVLPVAFADWHCEVVALELERSFWEKATILHTEYYRPAEKPTPDRFSRHYADTAALARHPAALKAMDRHDLRERVVTWKGQFFGSSWARYDLAKPGTFRLVPATERVADLRRDYESMTDMYLTTPPDFDEVMEILAESEQHINGASGAGQVTSNPKSSDEVRPSPSEGLS